MRPKVWQKESRATTHDFSNTFIFEYLILYKGLPEGTFTFILWIRLTLTTSIIKEIMYNFVHAPRVTFWA